MASSSYKNRFGSIPFFHLGYIMDYMVLLLFIYLFVHTKECWVLVGVLLWFCFFVHTNIMPFTEKYHLENDIIKIKTLRTYNEKQIPSSAIFVLSYTTVDYGVIFRKKYMVNIVDETLENVLEFTREKDIVKFDEAFRRGLYKKAIYDNDYVAGYFKHRFIYSFLYDEDTNKFFEEQDKTVIIPEILLDKINIQDGNYRVLSDTGRIIREPIGKDKSEDGSVSY